MKSKDAAIMNLASIQLHVSAVLDSAFVRRLIFVHASNFISRTKSTKCIVSDCGKPIALKTVSLKSCCETLSNVFLYKNLLTTCYLFQQAQNFIVQIFV